MLKRMCGEHLILPIHLLGCAIAPRIVRNVSALHASPKYSMALLGRTSILNR